MNTQNNWDKKFSGSNSIFKAPEDYFETLNEKVWNKIRTESSDSKTVNSHGATIKIRTQLVMVASFLVISIFFYSVVFYILGRVPLSDDKSGIYLAEYVEHGIYTLDETDLIELTLSPALSGEEDPEMQEYIIEYLLNSNLEFDILFNEL